MKKTVLVLLLDAVPWTRATLERVLEQAGWDVLWTAGLSEAMAAARRHPVDLLLLDFNRPLRGGEDPYERLLSLNPGARVVLLTKHPTAHERSLADAAGALLFEKPVNRDALTHALAALLAQRPARIPPGAPGAGDLLPAAAMFEERGRAYAPDAAADHRAAPLRHWGINE